MTLMPHISARHQRQHLSAGSRVRVVYILGAGRSGSTLLDTILGSHRDAVGVGELINLHHTGLARNGLCACGKPGPECAFWAQVYETWKQLVPEASLEGYIALQRRFEFYTWFGLVQIVNLLRQSIAPTQQFEAYVKQTTALYQAIAKTRGKAVVIDSSKSPVRAALLQKMPGIEARFIHLVRDPRAVAWARKKSFSKDPQGGIPVAVAPRQVWYSVAYWVFINVLSMLVCLLGSSRSIRVRYEDLVTEPDRESMRISHLIGLDYADVAQSIRKQHQLPISHPISGNRLRMKRSVTLRPDWEWKSKLSVIDRAACWLTGGWLMLNYGYRPASVQFRPSRLIRWAFANTKWSRLARPSSGIAARRPVMRAT